MKSIDFTVSPLLVFLLLGFIPVAYAQNLGVTQSFRAISLDQPINDLALVTGDTLVDFEIPSHRRSQAYLYQGDRVMKFVKKGTPVPEEGIATLPVIMQVPVNSSLVNPLYIFYPKVGEEDAAYGVFSVEDSPGRWGGGETLFVNLSPYPLLLLLGEDGVERVELQPQGTLIHSFEQESVNVRVRVAAFVDDAVHKGMDTRIFPASTHRDLYFIYPLKKGDTGNVRMRLLREHLNAAIRAYDKS